jgi:AraC-like DNA-binding protein
MLQHSIGSISFADPHELNAVAQALTRDLPAPQSNTETLILRGQLLEFACRWSAAAHARIHRRSESACKFEPAALLTSFCSDRSGDPRVALRGWAAAFEFEFSRRHPTSIASRAARILREEFDQALTAKTLSPRLGLTPRRLRAQFLAEFGVSLPEYKRIVRVIHALQQIATTKIEAVTMDIGYRSKKNFYRTFRAVTGLTPTAFRELSPQSAAALVDSIRFNLLLRSHVSGRAE